MKIQVIGSGCTTCKNLYELTKTAVSELGIKAEVEYSTDVSKIIEMGIMQSPLLAIDGRPLLVGSAGLTKIKEVLTKGAATPTPTTGDKCACGGKCC